MVYFHLGYLHAVERDVPFPIVLSFYVFFLIDEVQRTADFLTSITTFIYLFIIMK